MCCHPKASIRFDSTKPHTSRKKQPLLSRLENAKENLIENIKQKIKDTRQLLREQVHILEGASPKTILKRGYSMVTDQNGKIIKSYKDVNTETTLNIIPAEGFIKATVIEKGETTNE